MIRISYIILICYINEIS